MTSPSPGIEHAEPCERCDDRVRVHAWRSGGIAGWLTGALALGVTLAAGGVWPTWWFFWGGLYSMLAMTLTAARARARCTACWRVASAVETAGPLARSIRNRRVGFGIAAALLMLFTCWVFWVASQPIYE